MVTQSSILTWRIPWTAEPGGLQSIGLQRVGHNGSNLAHMHTYVGMITSSEKELDGQLFIYAVSL